MAVIYKKIQNIKLRWKLIIAFFILATIAGSASGVSLLFMDRIIVKMNRISETAFPLAAITRKLIGDMGDAHILILELLNTNHREAIQQQAERFDQKDKTLASQLDRLNEISENQNLQLDIGSLKTSQKTFFQQARQVISAHQDILEKEAIKNQKLAEFDQLGEETGKLLKSFSNVSEANINEKEEVAKTMEQSGEATTGELAGFISGMFTDDFPLLKSASLLEGYFFELMNVNAVYFDEQDRGKLDAIEKSFRSVIKKSHSRIKRTKRHLKTETQKETLQRVAAGFQFIENSVLGEDGLFADHRDYLKAQEQISTLLVNLSEAISGYRMSLAAISSSSEQINDNARTSMSALVLLAQKSMIGIIGVCIVIAVLFGVLVSGTITKPIKRIVDITQAIGQGDLSHRLGMDRGDEVGQLGQAIDAMAEKLKLNNAELKNSMAAMEAILTQGMTVAEVVNSGSSQILDTSHAVSHGASEQAASLEEVTSAMGLIASQIKSSTENASQADLMAKSVSDAAAKGNDRMKNVMGAMEGITHSSNEIAKIIKAIDDIAFQTNLLALNAAVEAARAGKYGKGFAVVAQEVRGLAGRSAEAARETAELIENSVNKTKGGAEIVNETALSFRDIVNGVVKVSDLVSEIAKASNEQSQAIRDINEGLTLIEQITQQNSATAEESASASVQLSAQAQKLKDILSRDRHLNQEIPPEKPLKPAKVDLPRPIKAIEPLPGKDGDRWGIKYQNTEPRGIAAANDGDFKDF